MTDFQPRLVLIALVLSALAACGAGGGSSPDEPTDPPDEVVREDYPLISDRSATGSAGMAYILLDGQTVESSDGVSITFSNGLVSGGDLTGLDIDESAFSNPANGEFSRVFRISGSNLFGVVGLDVLDGDLPAAGNVTSYNEGWVGMQAIFEDRVLTLEGDAEFTANWSGDLDGRFFNLSGQDSEDNAVNNVGTIILTDANISGDEFTGGSVTGTGEFAGLGGSSNTNGTQGFFFGPQADELGGVLKIDDTTEDIAVIGVFQAD